MMPDDRTKSTATMFAVRCHLLLYQFVTLMFTFSAISRILPSRFRITSNVLGVNSAIADLGVDLECLKGERRVYRDVRAGDSVTLHDCIPDALRLDAIQIIEQVLDVPDVAPLMRHAGPHALVEADHALLVVADDEPLPGRPDRVERAGPAVALRQVIAAELLLEIRDEVVVDS